MAKNKTTATKQSVSAFIDTLEDESKRDDSFALIAIMRDITRVEPMMWGPSIVGFGTYHYKYESGHEGDMPLAAFSPRKSALTIYFFNFPKRDDFLTKLGKHKASKGCVYIKKLADVEISVLKKMIAASIKPLPKK